MSSFPSFSMLLLPLLFGKSSSFLFFCTSFAFAAPAFFSPFFCLNSGRKSRNQEYFRERHKKEKTESKTSWPLGFVDQLEVTQVGHLWFPPLWTNQEPTTHKRNATHSKMPPCTKKTHNIKQRTKITPRFS